MPPRGQSITIGGVAGLLLAGALGAAVGAQWRLAPSDPLRDAKAAYADRDAAGAERLLRGRPEPEARLLLARLLVERGRLDEAHDLFGARLRENPSDADALRGMAQVHLGRRQTDLAIVHLQRAADARPGDASLWRELGFAQRLQGDSFGALSSFQRSLAIDKDQADLSVLLSDLALGGTAAGTDRDPLRPADPLHPRALDPNSLVPRPKLPPGPPQPPRPGDPLFQ